MKRIIKAPVLCVVMSLCGCLHSAPQSHEPNLLDNDVLQQRVQSALQRGGSDFRDVRARAQNGTISLTGNVGSGATRARAEKIARAVYGVKNVESQIQVNNAGL
ncbi:MAG: BON domain-containing protein [Phycisphaerae bacterium]